MIDVGIAEADRSLQGGLVVEDSLLAATRVTHSTVSSKAARMAE